MTDEIIPYLEMCQREGVSLQRGMNFGLGGTYSVILMSLRENAPYADRLAEDGESLIYEGHDARRSGDAPDPKTVDQPEKTPGGRLTQNGLFHCAAQRYKEGLRDPERVRVYEKIMQGIWSYNGMFHLVDSWTENDKGRSVFKFRLVPVERQDDSVSGAPGREPHRIIPTWVKLAVWKRDNGRCTKCGAEDDLHFDHIIPWSKGGSSRTPENVQLLCARHNLQKHDHIE
jgi:hypothetical protein